MAFVNTGTLAPSAAVGGVDAPVLEERRDHLGSMPGHGAPPEIGVATSEVDDQAATTAGRCPRAFVFATVDADAHLEYDSAHR